MRSQIKWVVHETAHRVFGLYISSVRVVIFLKCEEARCEHLMKASSINEPQLTLLHTSCWIWGVLELVSSSLNSDLYMDIFDECLWFYIWYVKHLYASDAPFFLFFFLRILYFTLMHGVSLSHYYKDIQLKRILFIWWKFLTMCNKGFLLG